MAGKIKGGYLRLAKTQTSAARRLITMPSATPARQLQFNCGPSKAVSHCAAGKRSVALNSSAVGILVSMREVD
jgi:hypothetical protein